MLPFIFASDIDLSKSHKFLFVLLFTIISIAVIYLFCIKNEKFLIKSVQKKFDHVRDAITSIF